MQAVTQTKVVVGLGKTGQACARFLRDQGFNVQITDSRIDPPDHSSLQQEYPDIQFRLGGIDQAMLCSADEIILSPGVSLKEPAVQSAIDAGIPVIGDIELFRRYVSEPIIAITGSNAKSTVTTLVGEMLNDAGYDAIVAGNIGVPVIDLLNQKQTAQYYVLELSSFQLETTYHLNAQVATILNVSPDHMDRYDTLEDYVRAKQRIYIGAENAVYLAGDPLTKPETGTFSRVFEFGACEPAEHRFGLTTVSGERWLALDDILILPTKSLKLKGKHNQLNALAALALGYSVGLSLEQMAQTLKRFEGLEHRCQYVTDIDGVSVYNDSKGTNVGATLAAIEGIGEELKPGQKIVLLAGGDGKGARFNELEQAISTYVRHAVLIGKDAPRIAAHVHEPVSCSRAHTMEDAVAQCLAHAVPGDVVLLSPACASFDMFKGFEDRGRKFIEAVAAVKKRKGA